MFEQKKCNLPKGFPYICKQKAICAPILYRIFVISEVA